MGATKTRKHKQSCAQFSNKIDHTKCCDISGCALPPSGISCITQSNLGDQDNKCPPGTNSEKATQDVKTRKDDEKREKDKVVEEEKKKKEEEKENCKDASGNPLSKLECFKKKNPQDNKTGGGKRTRRKKRHRKKKITRKRR